MNEVITHDGNTVEFQIGERTVVPPHVRWPPRRHRGDADFTAQ